MKLLFIIFLFFYSISINFGQETDENCDTTKITDFQSNLLISTVDLTNSERTFQLKKANEFAKKSCKLDENFCSDILYKMNSIYHYEKDCKILLTGYVLENAIGIEEKSASFFVLTVIQNGKFLYTEILEDLIGEIQVDLNGFSANDESVTIWGHAYPYFQTSYGKFRMNIVGGLVEYEFQCHQQEH